MVVAELCRICLRKTEDMMLVFNTINEIEEGRNQLIKSIMNEEQLDEHYASIKDLTINEMISAFNVNADEMKNADGFPNNVCIGCTKELCLAYIFRLRCNDSYYKIKKWLYSRKEQQETDSYDSNYVTNEILSVEQHQETNEVEYIGIREFSSAPKLEVIDEYEDYEVNIPAKHSNDDDIRNIDTIEDVDSSYNDDNDELVEVYEVVDQDESEPEDDITNENNDIPEGEIRNIIKCQYCPKQFSNVYDYVKHKNKEHLIQHQCPNCEEIFMCPEQLFHHALIAHLDTPFKCCVCEEEFNCKETFYVHRTNHINKKEELPLYLKSKGLECEHCNQKFIAEKEFVSHVVSCKLKKMRIFFCKPCLRRYANETSFKLHTTFKHEKINECKTCEKNFETRKELNEHSKEHADERPYLCFVCGNSFKTTSAFNLHIKSHNNKRKYKCKYCHKRFNFRSLLTTHERIHTGEKPYNCVRCEKSFTLSRTLVLHMRTHTGQKPFKCMYCDKAFITNTFLKVHIRRHTGVRPSKCNLCDKRFYTNYDLKIHIRRHTGERFKCKICNKGFIHFYLLTRHTKTEHGYQETLQTSEDSHKNSPD